MRSYPTGELAADANFILNSKEHVDGGGRNELHYAQTEDTIAEVVRLHADCGPFLCTCTVDSVLYGYSGRCPQQLHRA